MISVIVGVVVSGFVVGARFTGREVVVVVLEELAVLVMVMEMVLWVIRVAEMLMYEYWLHHRTMPASWLGLLSRG